MIFDTETYFKALATTNNWGFSYGRKDYQNIYDITTEIKNKLAATTFNTLLYCQELSQDLTNNTVTFEVLLAKKSDFKEGDYSVRNQTSVLPMKQDLKNKIIDIIDCKYTVERCIVYDKINEFDKNMDGVLANITMKYFN